MIYVDCKDSKKMEAWNHLMEISSRNKLPWLCIGTFNTMTSSDKKDKGSFPNAKKLG